MTNLRIITLSLALALPTAGCGDDTSGGGGAGGESAVTTNNGNGTGTGQGEDTFCADGEQILCQCADGSDGSQTCFENAFSPCSNGNGDCSR